jgi:hypothetical protein
MRNNQAMRLGGTAAIFSIALTAVIVATDRDWESGVLIDVATKQSLWIGDPSSGTGPVPTRPRTPVRTEVATYVIETEERRLELEDIVPIGTSPPARELTVGRSVTFALSKKTAYVRLSDGKEYRLRVIKNGPKR